MVINVFLMQTRVYHVNKLLWVFRQSKSNRVRRADSAVQMWEILFICFLCLSTDIETLWSCSEKHRTNLKTTATPRQALRRLTFPGGDPVTQWHTSFLKSPVSCSAVLNIPSRSPQHTDSHVSGRELKQLVMGVCVRSTIPPPSLTNLLLPSPTLPLTPSPSPFPSASGPLWDWEQECVWFCSFWSVWTALVWPCGEHRIYTRIQTRLSLKQTPPTSHTFTTELRPLLTPLPHSSAHSPPHLYHRAPPISHN